MTEYRYLHLVRASCPLPPGSHVVGYCRDSGNEDQERSIDQQRGTIEEFCKHYGLVLEQVYVDEAKQGSSSEKRDNLREMLLMLHNRFRQIHDRHKRSTKKKAQPFGVIFWKSNRLGRDSIETRFIKTDLRLRAVTLIDLMNSGTGEESTDVLLEAFQEWEDESFLDDLGENTSRGLYEIVTTRDSDPDFRALNPDWPTNDGRYLGILPGTPPKGFRGEPVKVSIKQRKHRAGEMQLHVVQRLVPDHENNVYARCKLAWQMRHEGHSIGQIHKATQIFKGVNSYSSFFRNKIYIGVLEYGDKCYENFVEPMISREWFDAEQKNVAARSEKAKGNRVEPHLEPRRVGSRFLLSGLLFCGTKPSEEHAMVGDTVPANEKRSQWDFFICTTMKNSRKQACDCKRIGAEALNYAVIDKIMTDILTRENLRPIADELARAMTETNRDVTDRMTGLQGRLSEVQSAISKLMDVIETVGISPNVQKRLADREAEERDLNAQIADLQTLVIRARDIPRITNKKLDEFIASMRETLLGNDVERARMALQRFVAKIVVHDKTGTIYYSFPFHDISRLPTLPLSGFRTRPCSTPSDASTIFIDWIYFGETPPDAPISGETPRKNERNEEIRKRYAEGESIPELAKACGLSNARVHQILHGRRR